MNRKYSLKANHQIKALLDNKKSVGSKFFVIYYIKNNLDKPLVAISVSKRFGNAVHRNYQKRVIKEILRKYILSLSGYSFLLVAKTTIIDLSFEEKEKELCILIERIKRSINEKL